MRWELIIIMEHRRNSPCLEKSSIKGGKDLVLKRVDSKREDKGNYNVLSYELSKMTPVNVEEERRSVSRLGRGGTAGTVRALNLPGIGALRRGAYWARVSQHEAKSSRVSGLLTDPCKVHHYGKKNTRGSDREKGIGGKVRAIIKKNPVGLLRAIRRGRDGEGESKNCSGRTPIGKFGVQQPHGPHPLLQTEGSKGKE